MSGSKVWISNPNGPTNIPPFSIANTNTISLDFANNTLSSNFISLNISQFNNDSLYLSTVSTDGSTITGNGTPGNPLVAIGGGSSYITSVNNTSTISLGVSTGVLTGTFTSLNISQFTNNSNYITLGSISGTSPISYNNSTGVISIVQSTTSTNGYLSSTDWNSFNSKGSGTVTSTSIVTANGLSGSVATATTTPAITLTLGAITPSSVNSVVISGSSTPILAVTGTTSVSGSNTGDQTNISGNAGTVTTNANLTGPITSVGNTTSIASQTGTGSKFVVDTSPTLITPILGTPSSGTLTSCTGLPLTTGVTGILPIVNGGTGGSTSSGVSGALANLNIQDSTLLAYQAAGSQIKAQTVGMTVNMITTSAALGNQIEFFIPVYLYYAQTLTGVMWYQTVKGNYTANNNNRIGLCTYSGGTLTLVASCANDGTLWQTASSNTYGTKAFSSTYNAAAGLYYITLLYCESAQTTAPSLGFATNASNLAVFNLDLKNSAKMGASSISTRTDLITSQAMSGTTGNIFNIWSAVY